MGILITHVGEIYENPVTQLKFLTNSKQDNTTTDNIVMGMPVKRTLFTEITAVRT
jgi:hypothetical protein